MWLTATTLISTRREISFPQSSQPANSTPHTDTPTKLPSGRSSFTPRLSNIRLLCYSRNVFEPRVIRTTKVVQLSGLQLRYTFRTKFLCEFLYLLCILNAQPTVTKISVPLQCQVNCRSYKSLISSLNGVF